MEKYRGLTSRKVEKFMRELFERWYFDRTPLNASMFKTPEPVPYREIRKRRFKPVTLGQDWGRGFDCAWFRLEGRVPASLKGKKIVALIDVGGEGLVFDGKGEPVVGLTRKEGQAGKPILSLKNRVDLLGRAKGGEPVRLHVDAGATGLFGARDIKRGPRAYFKQAELAGFRQDLWDLYQDFDVLFKLMKTMDEKTRHRRLILWAMNDAVNAFEGGSPADVRACRAILAEELGRKAGSSALKVSAIGHAHLDVGWLWPLRETTRKAGRTFSTALKLMDEFPDYRFGSSQPYLYHDVKQHYPGLYRRIKKAVKDGRWECQGAMWVEADCNVTSGESLVRQVVHGKRFFMQEFGVEVDNLWLPDVFGYSAALPQILRKAGVDYFMTQKISWNQFNKFPHHTFTWRGIDGSEVFAHFLTNDSYNSSGTPADVKKLETNNQDIERNPYALHLFGIGDGGGGPSREHIESLTRMASLESVPKVKMEFSSDFFKKAKRDSRGLCVWCGELYLELHRGTLTTQALVKKRNRLLERLLRDIEMLYALYRPHRFPAARVDEIWKTVLVNQFHDIIPGSSINRVYRETHEMYEAAISSARALLDDIGSVIAREVDTGPGRDAQVIVNTLSWPVTGFVVLDRPPSGSALACSSGEQAITQPVVEAGRRKTLVRLKAPSCGHAVLKAVEGGTEPQLPRMVVRKNRLENGLLRVEFDGAGRIARILDKACQREVLEAGRPGNRLVLFEDNPVNYDAWDVDLTYEEKPPEEAKLQAVRVLEEGPLRGTLEFTFFGTGYALRQRVSLREGSRRIDFATIVDWKPRHRMLRVEFPVNVRSPEATYEIQYGNVKRPTHRNTSWDMAQFEVVGHKWADLSQENYGVAILNDCKYGHQIRDNVISLALLRSPKDPDPKADMHTHAFTYALFPHEGNHVRGRVIQEAYELNHPLQVIAAAPRRRAGAKRPPSQSFVSLDKENIVVEVVKPADDGQGTVLRLYESCGMDTTAELRFGSAIGRVDEVDLLERRTGRLRAGRASVPLSFGPFEIKTIRVTARP